MPDLRLISCLGALVAVLALLPATASAQRPPPGGGGGPANDDFANAVLIPPVEGSGSMNASDSTAGATKQANEPNHAGDPGGSSVWFKFTPPYPGRWRASLYESFCDGWAPLLGIYSGESLGALSPIGSGRGAAGNPDSDNCDGATAAVTTLNLGVNQTYYAAVDGVGGAETHDFSLSILYLGDAPPDTEITKATIRSRPRTATFRFDGDDPDELENGMTFQCKIDARSWSGCKSPKTYRNLKRGRHVFRVRAINSGKTDPTPAKRVFRIRRVG